MQTTHDFLDALELDEDAQERDIRRAYARKLKRIDQETEAAAFQALRHAYEVALDWARWKLAQPAQDVPDTGNADTATGESADDPHAVVVDSDEPQTAPPDAARLGGDVFERFRAAAGELVAAGRHGDPDAWRQAIEARFADDELVNIDARIYFEAYVAALLASGWHTGHEALFVAAGDAFAWSGDRRRLWQLGQAGRFVDQAIEERQLFEAQPTTERARTRDLAKLLRQDTLPVSRRVRAAMPDVERMLGRFPAFMSIVTSMDNVERWRSIYRESGGAPIAAESEEPPAPPQQPERRFSTWQGILILLALTAVLRAMYQYSGGEQAAGRGFIPPASQGVSSAAVAPTILDKVVPPVYYTPPPDIEARELEVVYRVFLDANHKVERVQNWATSGDPGFDQAVADALLAAKAFPPATPREFQVRYTGGMTRKGQARARAANARTPAAVAPPARRVEIPEAVLRAHLPPVRFKPTRYMREGEYVGHYQVVLHPSGKVKEVHVTTSSGDIRLDRAVADAVRAARPFPPGSGDFSLRYGTRIFLKPAPPKPEDKAAPEQADPEPEPAPEQ